MDVSIIFVNYKTKDLTINAINSVINKTQGIEYEIIVVDNNSQDGSIENIEKEFPNINIIKNSVNAGFGGANNLGIEQAQGKYVLCLNTDTLLVNNAIKIMFDYMEKEENQNVGVCGGYLFDGNDKPAVCGGNLPTPTEIFWKLGLRYIFVNLYKQKYSSALNSEEIKGVKKVGYITGADIFFRKSVLDEVGLFDKDFFMYYEESELCKRIIETGYSIQFVDDAKIQHLENRSVESELKHLKMLKTSEFIYFKKHYPNSVLFIKLIYIICYLVDWIVLRNKNSKELLFFILKGCKD